GQQGRQTGQNCLLGCGSWASTAPPSPDLPWEYFPVADPKRTAKPDQRLVTRSYAGYGSGYWLPATNQVRRLVEMAKRGGQGAARSSRLQRSQQADQSGMEELEDRRKKIAQRAAAGCSASALTEANSGPKAQRCVAGH